MVGFPYDQLDGWRGIYPPEIFIAQLEKVAGGFEQALAELRQQGSHIKAMAEQRRAWERECGVAEAAAIHFRSAANQARFVMARDALAKSTDAARGVAQRAELKRWLESELARAQRLYELQRSDSRLSFQASNQYYYVPVDLIEKVLNCHELLACLAAHQPIRSER